MPVPSDGKGAMSLIATLVQDEGGLDGIMAKFHKGGLSEVVQSWISKGKNMPITAEQVRSVLGSETVHKLASSAGLDPDMVTSKLAAFLPDTVDKMTPDGQMPAEGLSAHQVFTKISSLFGGKEERSTHA